MPAQSGRDPLKLLVVVAHPHDFTHCAGTCGIHMKMGDSVTVVTMTDGGRKHNERFLDEMSKPEHERDPAILNQSIEEYAAAKARELHEVCAIFGVEDLRILTMPEPFRLRRSPEAIDLIRDVILDVRPDVLITHAPYDTSPASISTHGRGSMLLNDHRECAITAMEAKLIAAEVADYESRIPPHRIAEVFYLGVDVPHDDVDVYIDIGEWKQQRVQAECMFKTQGQSDEFARYRVEISAGGTGWWGRTNYAEGFVRAEPETLPCLPVSAWAKVRATASRVDQLQHRAGQVKLGPQ